MVVTRYPHPPSRQKPPNWSQTTNQQIQGWQQPGHYHYGQAVYNPYPHQGYGQAQGYQQIQYPPHGQQYNGYAAQQQHPSYEVQQQYPAYAPQQQYTGHESSPRYPGYAAQQHYMGYTPQQQATCYAPTCYAPTPPAGYMPQQHTIGYAPPQTMAYTTQQPTAITAYPAQSYLTTPRQSNVAPTTAWQLQDSTLNSAAPQQGPPSAPFGAQRRHNSGPRTNAVPKRTGPLDGKSDTFSQQQSQISDEALGEYCRDPYFKRHPEEIDPRFSLGDIHYRPAGPMRLAMPATYAEAELEVVAPRRLPPTGDNCVSDYHRGSTGDEALKNVRRREHWGQVQGDPIFYQFPQQSANIIPAPQVPTLYQDRRDPSWTAPAPASTPSPIPTPEPRNRPTQAGLDDDSTGGAMDMESSNSGDAIQQEDTTEQDDMLGDLEKALMQNGHEDARRQSQEEVLAALGVEGSPQPCYPTFGPAKGPPPETFPSLSAESSRKSSLASAPGTAANSLPLGPPPGLPSGRLPYKPSSASSHAPSSRRSSSASAPGGIVVSPPPPGPPPNTQPWRRSTSNYGPGDGLLPDRRDPRNDPHRRKRGHDSDDDDDKPEESRRQEDDETPRQRRKQQRTDGPKVDDAFK